MNTGMFFHVRNFISRPIHKKCPEGSGKRTIEQNIRKAVLQSHYIIVDLRWIRVPEKQCLSQLELNFKTKPAMKRLLVIKKDLELVEFPKND